jgi:hypothetical protein
MGTRNGRTASIGRAATLLLFILSLSVAVPGCRKAAGPSEPVSGSLPVAGYSEPARAPREPDAAVNRLFAGIAGITEPQADRAVKPDDAVWTAYAKFVSEEWGHFDSSVLEPMASWAGVELKEARKATRSLLYAFGGPDFATSDALFPEARETVLIGLEPAGNLPEFDRVSAAWREAFFTDMEELIKGFLERGYFITSDMNDIYGRGKVDGALPVIAFFLARRGCSIVEMTRLAPEATTGGWVETPYERLAQRPRRPYGVKIVYLKPGDPEPRTVVYFSCDIENKAFPVGSPLYRYFAGLERMSTFVKSGSYLLHYGDFSTLRDLILSRSEFVLQDDTAVPYRYFKKGKWQVQLFGIYTQPVKDFTNVEQPDLKRAYEEDAKSIPSLPFHFGYHWRTQIDNLLLAKRPRRPYKSPVVR